MVVAEQRRVVFSLSAYDLAYRIADEVQQRLLTAAAERVQSLPSSDRLAVVTEEEIRHAASEQDLQSLIVSISKAGHEEAGPDTGSEATGP
jgi:transposase